MSTRTEYRQQFLPEVDHRLAVWQAYLNCLNAFQGNDMVGGSDSGLALNLTRTTQERFVYCLGVLDGLLNLDKDEAFNKVIPNSLPDLLESSPSDGMGRFQDFPAYLRYWQRVDELMRRQGFYTTRKNVSHL